MSASQKFMGVVKGLILSYLLTIIMLFITAVVVYKVGISDKVLFPSTSYPSPVM